jgi:hypothetical protein
MDPRLRAAALKGDVEALTTALNEGADPNQCDDDGYGPLLYAASNGHASCIDVLTRHGAAVNANARCGRTPLNTAAAGGHTEAIKVKLVLECGGFEQYARSHRTRLAWILGRGTRVPAELLPTIIDFWAHVGWYALPQWPPPPPSS